MSEHHQGIVSPTQSPAACEARKAAWDHFYNHCISIIQTCSSIRRLAEADREDCMQEVMTEIVRRFGDGHAEAPQADVKGLLLTLSRNKAADIVRRKYRKPETPFDDGAGGSVPAGSRSRPDSIDRSDAVSLVWEALTCLDLEVPMTSYLAFYLRTIEDWSIPEIAELLGLTPEQTRVRCHRVKKRFAEILAARDGSVLEPRPE
jgi:RNA polymerase sigma-70 factor (ECF subfamily)